MNDMQGLPAPLPGRLAGIALPAPAPLPAARPPRAPAPEGDKRVADLTQVLDRFGLRDGQVISFHHHYRNGERVIEPVLRAAQSRGLRGLTLAASSLFPCHAGLIPFIEDGTVTHIVTDYMRGPLADAVQAGRLAGKAVLQSHGARARAIGSGARPMRVQRWFLPTRSRPIRSPSSIFPAITSTPS